MQISLFGEADDETPKRLELDATSALSPVYTGGQGQRFVGSSADLVALQAQLTKIDIVDGQLHLLPQWLAADTSERLMSHLSASLAWEQSEIQLYGQQRKIPRLNAWYGDPDASYQYSGLHLDPLAWTPALLQLRAAMEQSLVHLGFTQIKPLNSVLANLYRNEQDSVAWHSDDEPELGRQPLIVSLSLGATRRFSLKHKRIKHERRDLMLNNGSLLVMSGASQKNWQHALLKQTAASGPRINLTFRHIV